jgi:hypothetical protein
MHLHAQLILRLVSLAIFAVFAAVACVSGEATDPLMGERVLSVDAQALDRLLARGADLTGTPLGREAARLRNRLGACEEVWGDFENRSDLSGSSISEPPDLADLADASDAIRCDGDGAARTDLRGEVRRLRGDHAGLLLWPIGEDGRLEIRFDVDADGGLRIDGLALPPSEQNAWRLLIPDDEAPAPAVLAREPALLYARARPAGGIALSRLIPSGRQGDRLFALKGRLLEGALLDGTWEFAFMPPMDGTNLPLATLALHHRLAAPVREALREALDQLERTWPIRRTARVFTTSDGQSHEGGCYFELPLLPGLAPCWVVTEKALLVGYRDVALEVALAASPSGIATPPETAAREQADESQRDAADSRFGGLDVHLSRFSAGSDVPPDSGEPKTRPHPGDLYSRLQVDLAPAEGGRVALSGSLKAIR